jgi:virulence factor Mce-like protein
VRRVAALTVLVALVGAGCAALRGGSEPRTYKARFSRAIQLFPGGSVRVLGVDVGEVQDVRNVPGAVEVTLLVDDPDVQLPADVQAVIVPVSLLGERYIQLLPAYQGGPVLEEGATIPLERTAVPAEPDELLRSLQDYLGAIDPEAVSEFVANAAAVLKDTGDDLNNLIHHGARVIGTLSSKRDDLAEIIVQFERLSQALSTRQEGIARVIRSYNDVIGTLTDNRAAVEGTITGLNDAAVELASLLLEHEAPLHEDIQSLARTGRTLARNAETLADTGHWAERLFKAASRAVDYEKNWLRLNNQGEPLGAMIVLRLEQRLMEFCADLELASCATPQFWAANVPSLFCFDRVCPTESKKADQTVQEQLVGAIAKEPTLADVLLKRFRNLSCQNAADRQACLQRKQILLECARADHPRACLKRHAAQLACLKADDVQACLDRELKADLADLVKGLLDDTVGNPGLVRGQL